MIENKRIIEENNTEILFISVCSVCKHKYETKEGCKAFDIIPDEILLGESKHTKPLKGQGNDIVFEAKNDDE